MTSSYWLIAGTALTSASQRWAIEQIPDIESGWNSWSNWFAVLICTLFFPSRVMWDRTYLPDVLVLDWVPKHPRKDVLLSGVRRQTSPWTQFGLSGGWVRGSGFTNSLPIAHRHRHPWECALLSWPADDFLVEGYFYFPSKESTTQTCPTNL